MKQQLIFITEHSSTFTRTSICNFNDLKYTRFEVPGINKNSNTITYTICKGNQILGLEYPETFENKFEAIVN